MLRLRTAVVSALAAITMAVSTAVPSAAAPAAPPSTTTSGGTTVTGTTETSTSETMKARTSAPTTSTPPPGPDQGLPPDPTTEAAESGTTTTTAPSRPSALLAGCSEQQFWDVAVTDQFCPQVTWLASTGVTTGYTDPGQAKPGFHPTASVSRQAMAAFLYRYGFNGQADPACAGSFRLFGDVPAGGFCGSIEWLAGAGISGGYADGGFHPTAAVSRQAMAAFLYRFAHPGQTAPACTAQQFWDVPVGDPFCPQISWLASTGITTGYTDSGHSQPGFHPASAVSRQAMAAFLYRADDQDVIALNGATPLPAVTGIDPESGPTAGGTTVTITGTGLTGATQALFDLPGAASPAAGTNLVVVSATKVTVTAPAHAAGRLPVRVTTAAGTSVPATATYTYTGASAAPTITSISPATGPVTGGTTVTLTGTNLTGATGVRFGSTPGTALSVTSPTSLTVKSPAGSTGAVDVSVTTPGGTATTTAGHGFTYTAIGLPPDPATVAGPLDPSTPTDLQSATSFLYSGDNPIQVGVAAGTITQQRAAVLRGHVLARGGQPLSGVTVSVAGHPEFGHTTTRTDGGYDLAVNGGGRLILDFAKQGYAGAQREVSTAWQNYRTVDDVTLIAYDSAVTAVDLAGSETGPQVAQGSPVTDDSGTRQATLLFQPGTTATATRPDGSTLTLSTAHVRATEFTVGQDGPSAMPGILPQLSAYTYAAEFSVDEAVAAGAQTVTFSKPVINYTENFLHFSVGTPVPTGYYDRDKHSWVAAANGRVIKVLAVTGGVATLDVAGKGKAATPAELSALGITDAELTTIGGLYAAGTSLWRVAIDHFTPWDHNWPFAPPPGATAPKLPELSVDSTDSCQGDVSGSVIGCQNQTLGERLPVAGTSLTLAYQNERTPGRDNSTVRIPLTGDTVPAGATAVVFKTEVAGQRSSARMQIKPNLSTTAHWDGKDAYGRTVQGSALMEISVGFVYPGSYAVADGSGSSFGSYGAAAIDGDRAREEVTLWATTQQVPVGGWDARGVGLGGWTLSAQHFYDPVSRQLYLGDGSQTGGGELLRTMKPVAGSGTLGSTGDGGDATAARLNYPTSVAVAADGTMYIADTANSRVRRVNPDGTIDTIAGNGNLADTGDGGPATAAGLRPTAIAIAPDGSLVVGTANHRVRQFTPGGTIKTIAGTGAQGWSGNGGPATAATFGTIASLKYSPNGTLYVVDGASCQIRTIDAAGVLRRVAGIQPLPDSNNPGCGTGSTDGGKADKTFLASPSDVAFLPDGSMLIADTGNSRVRRMAPDGIITTVLPVDAPTALAVLPSGGWLVTDTWTRNQLKWVDTNGTVRVLAGTGLPGNTGDGGPAAKAAINKATSLAVAPDGRIVFTDSANNRVRAITVPNTGQTDDQLAVVSADGGQIFHFDHGRQVSTIDARTGVTVRTLRYDGAGRLTGLTDVDGNVTTIERDGSGKPTGIRAPGGQLTTLELDAHGYLSAVTAPGSKPTTLTSDPNGLLRTLTEPGGGQHAFDYDNRGLLLKDRSPDGRSTTLAGSSTATSHTVTLTTSLGQVSTMTVETLGDGSVRRTTVAPSGAKTVATIGTDGTGVITEPDGSVLTSVVGPDPRFGMAAPILASQTLRTPAGLVTTRTTTLTADLSDPANAMSLTRLTRKVTTNGRTTTTVLDNTAHTIVVTTPEGRSRTTTTDEHGKVIGYDLGAGIAPVTLSYDDTGAPLTMAQGGQSVTYSYDSRHRVATMTDRAHRVTTFGYDGADRLTSVTAPGTGVTKYAYDDNGRVTEITQPGGRVHRFTYDDGGRVATDTPAGAGTVSNTYDTDGALTQRATPGRTTELDQDGKGRLSSATDADGTVTFGYDPATGRLTGTGVDAGDPATTAARAFTFDGPLPTGTSVTGPAAAAFAYTYNADLMPTRTVLTAGTDTVTVDRSYDKDLALTGVGGYTITRGSGGAATGMSDGTAAWTYHYDQFGRVDRQVLTVAGHAISTLELTWGADGSLAARTDPANPGTQLTYGYDADGHLTTVKRGGTVIESYGYDADGRRITRTLGATPAQSFGYDDADRLTSTGGVSRQYSPDGSLTVRGSDTFGYGVGGMLTSATVGGTTVSYTYDAEGRRTTRTTGGQTTSYYYGSITSANRVSAIRGGDGVLTSLLYDEFGHLASYDRAGQRFYVVTDQVGSPVAVTDAAGTVIKKVAYDSFGNVVSDSAPAVLLPLGFAGGLADPVTGLVRFGQRDYEPATGRWTTRDPAGLAAGQLDVYAYVADDPASRSDLSGLGDDEEPGEEQEYASLDLWQYNKDRFAKLYDTAVDKVKGFVASKLCLGPVCVNPEHPEMSVGKDVTVNAGGDDVLTVGAKCTVGVTENPNLHEDNFSWKLKLAAAIPALKKIPLVGKYLGIDETYSGGFGSVDNYFGLDRSTIRAAEIGGVRVPGIEDQQRYGGGN